MKRTARKFLPAMCSWSIVYLRVRSASSTTTRNLDAAAAETWSASLGKSCAIRELNGAIRELNGGGDGGGDDGGDDVGGFCFNSRPVLGANEAWPVSCLLGKRCARMRSLRPGVRSALMPSSSAASLSCCHATSPTAVASA
eukprot:scaffold27240_cov64-Phaeocystis_antarctica.AAC.5